MTHSLTLRLALATVLTCGTFHLRAQDATAEAESKDAAAEPTEGEVRAKQKEMFEAIGWTRSGKFKIGSNAEIEIPDGLQLTNGAGASKVMRLFGNPPSSHDLALLGTPDLSWWATFKFEAEGYVKDDDKDKIDADELLKGHREIQDQANEQRKKQGLDELSINGWAVPPYYNEQSKTVEYGLRVGVKGAPSSSESVNYNTKILGRHGWMDVDLVCNPRELDSSLAALRDALKGFNYTSGETYAEYKKGDKVSEYGVAALLGAGTLAVAAKTGLLAKLGSILAKGGKLLIVGAIALMAAVKKGWDKIRGRGNA